MVRSNFLVHWTGKDICADRQSVDNTIRLQYLDRLRAILLDGFWMTIPPERIIGNGGRWIEYTAPLTCFTEVRLSQAEAHSGRYGLLGVAVDRKFVLDRYGGPVHYVRNGQDEAIVGNVQVMLDEINRLTAGNSSSAGVDLVNLFAMGASFLKAMSDPNSDNFKYIEEHEWRIVHTHHQQQRGRLSATGASRPTHKIPISVNDLKLIVFPDDDTRSMARNDRTLQPFLACPLLTIEECLNF
jgi:hypothetical protein